MRVEAQYPPRRTGLGVEGQVRPRGTIDWLVALANPYKRDEEPNVSIVPAGTDTSLTSFPSPPRRILPYFHRVPPGRLLPAHIPSRYVDAGGLSFMTLQAQKTGRKS